MASDWIKMRSALQSHPKVVRILSATMSDKFRVIGGLHAVWSVFDTHCVDGILIGYTPSALDHIIGWDGFAAAMIEVGWLEIVNGDSLKVPEFTEHNGQSAKRRAEDQKRKKNSRKCPQSVRNLSAEQPDKSETREEKSKKEDIYTPAPKAKKKPAQTSIPDDFGISPRVQAWADEKGHRKLPARLEHFIGYARRSGKQYADWDEAFMAAIREDWAKLNTTPDTGAAPASVVREWSL